MPSRICDVCGNEKDVYGGKVCSKGHFVCKDERCHYSDGAYRCPLDDEPLR